MTSAHLNTVERLGLFRGHVSSAVSDIQGLVDTLIDCPDDENVRTRVVAGFLRVANDLRAKDAELDAGRQS